MTHQEKIIYAAGFVDGEGCIGVDHNVIKRTYKTTGRYVEYNNFQLRLQVAQKVREPLDLLVELFGGAVKPKVLHGSTYFHWELYNQKALVAISQLFPYMIVKRESAWNGMEFAEMQVATRPKATVARSASDVAKMHAFNAQSRKLNQRNSVATDYTKIEQKETSPIIQ